MNFKNALSDQTIPINIDFDPQKKVLLLAFGGIGQRMGMPWFEFTNITKGLNDVNKIFLRDSNKIWYHRGLAGVGNDIQGIVAFLQQYTTHTSTQKVIIFGNSGGGYAALLFGNILKANEVHAFSPKTFISPIKRIKNDDIPPNSRPIHLFRLYLYGQRRYFDLKKVFLKSPPLNGSFHIYYSQNNRKDNLQAVHMKPISGIHLHPIQFNQHNVIRTLKKSGELAEIIEQAISFDN